MISMLSVDRQYFSIIQGCSNGFGFVSSIVRCAIARMAADYYQTRITIAMSLGEKDVRDLTLQRDYYSGMEHGTWKAYELFGDHLINPAMNCPRSEALSELYHESGTESAKLAITNMVPEDSKFKLVEGSNPTYLEKNKDSFDGICFTISQNFIHDVLEYPIDDLTPDVIKSISEKYTDGGNAETVRLQSFQDLQVQNKDSKIIQIDEIKLENALAWLKNFKPSLNEENETPSPVEAIPEETSSPVETTSQISMAQILESLEEKISSHSPEQRFIAEQLGVKIGSPNKPNFDELEPGVYLIETSRSKGETISLTGHAIAYIKLKNHGFLFDPNLGTVYVPKGKDAEYIQHCLNNIKHDTYTLARCTKRI